MEANRASGNACAGDSAWSPAAGDLVCYYPKIHGLYASAPPPGSPNFSFLQLCQYPPMMFPCQVLSTSLSSHSIGDDESYATLTLCPVPRCVSSPHEAPPPKVKAAYFEKVLSQTDVGYRGRLYLPRACANSIFSARRKLTFLDESGDAWEFKHVYLENSSHFLTDGWSKFVQGKSLVQGDSVIFSRNLNGQLFIDVRRSADHNSYQPGKCISWWKEGCCPRRTMCRISQEAVVEAVSSAFAEKPFKVKHYPELGLPEYVVAMDSVKSSSVELRETGMKRSMKEAAADPVQPAMKKIKLEE